MYSLSFLAALAGATAVYAVDNQCLNDACRLPGRNLVATATGMTTSYIRTGTATSHHHRSTGTGISPKPIESPTCYQHDADQKHELQKLKAKGFPNYCDDDRVNATLHQFPWEQGKNESDPFFVKASFDKKRRAPKECDRLFTPIVFPLFAGGPRLPRPTIPLERHTEFCSAPIDDIVQKCESRSTFSQTCDGTVADDSNPGPDMGGMVDNVCGTWRYAVCKTGEACNPVLMPKHNLPILPAERRW